MRELEQAELDCESALVKKWHDAAPDDWRAARDLLARRFPDRWGREVEEMPAYDGIGLHITLLLGEDGGEESPRHYEIPAVSEEAARAIEGSAPGTKIESALALLSLRGTDVFISGGAFLGR